MPDQINAKTEFEAPVIYQIRVQGHLGSEWADWFGGLRVTQEGNGESLLTGPVLDQAALHGLFKKIRDMGLPLIAVNRVKADTSERKG